MARYYMHLRNGADEVLDLEGAEHATPDAMRAAVLSAGRDIIKGDVDHGVIDLRFRIDAVTEAGETVYSLPFSEAVSIVPPERGQSDANDA